MNLSQEMLFCRPWGSSPTFSFGCLNLNDNKALDISDVMQLCFRQSKLIGNVS